MPDIHELWSGFEVEPGYSDNQQFGVHYAAYRVRKGTGRAIHSSRHLETEFFARRGIYL